MSGYMTVCRIPRAGANVSLSLLDEGTRPGESVIFLNEDGTYLSIHIRPETADIADSLAEAFTRAAQLARAASQEAVSS